MKPEGVIFLYSMKLKDLANSTGFSVSTVSRVINGESGPSEKAVEAIMRVARESGYLNRRRRTQADQKDPSLKHNTLALVQLHDGNRCHASLFVELLRGVGQAAADHHFNLIIVQAATLEQLPPVISEKRVDGLLMLGPWKDGPVEEELAEFPSVWLTTSNPEGTKDAVLAGNDKVGQLAANYLIGLGHRQVACLNGAASSNVTTTRCETFLFHAQRAGVQASSFSRPGGMPRLDGSSGWHAFEKEIGPHVDAMLDAGPTGVFVPDDLVVTLVYRLLRRAGVEPGKDIDVIGVGHEMPYLAGLDPRPATINMGGESIGRHAVEHLLLRLRNPDIDRAVEVAIQPQLVPAERVCKGKTP